MKVLKSAISGYVGNRSSQASADHNVPVSSQREHTPAELREALVTEFPEIDGLCSDKYLSDVMSVPNRQFEYARDEKIRKALEWRREYGVDRMCSRFQYNMMNGVLEVLPATSDLDFEPCAGLLKLCRDGAFQILPDRDDEGHIVLHSQTQRIDYHDVGVEAGMQYHVLIMEAALKMIRSENRLGPESMVLLADASGALFAKPPPVAALKGLVSLLQRAYPDRIHHICVGPVNVGVRGLYKLASQFMSINSRHKILLVGHRPLPGGHLGETANLADGSATANRHEHPESTAALAGEVPADDNEKPTESRPMRNPDSLVLGDHPGEAANLADGSATANHHEHPESKAAVADEVPADNYEKPTESRPMHPGEIANLADVSAAAIHHKHAESTAALADEVPADDCEKPTESRPTHPDESANLADGSATAIHHEHPESTAALAGEVPADVYEKPTESKPMRDPTDDGAVTDQILMH